MKETPIAVLISDIHYNLNTLDLADKAMNMAIDKAEELVIPVIVAGDLHDTKANLRAECVNRMLKTFSRMTSEDVILIGNHDKINEKSEGHSLEFLKALDVTVENQPTIHPRTGLHLIPYQHDTEVLRNYLKSCPKGSTIIMHQGLTGAAPGEYTQDKSAISYEDVRDFRVISGHYHTRQDIRTGRPQRGGVGLFSYIGNPYSLNFGEASDPDKGFQVLYADGSLEFVPTNMRRHIVFNMASNEIGPQTILSYNAEDLLWLKVTGTKEELARLNREIIIAKLDIKATSVRIDMIPIETLVSSQLIETTLSKDQTLDNLIDSESTITVEQKVRLKQLWRDNI